MSTPTWTGEDDYPTFPKITIFGWIRVAIRGALIVFTLLIGIIALSAIRLIEKPFFGLRRPAGGYIPSLVCRAALAIMGVTFTTKGDVMRRGGAVVANHSSWMDIFTLNARNPVFFVSKSEVASWPGVGFIARLAGTVFISRDRKQAKKQQELFEGCLEAGQKLLFFPEGTSTDAQRVLPFKSTLFAAFFSENLRPTMRIQPVSVNYHAPNGADPRFYGWWGDMEFGAHMLQMLAARKHGRVEVVYHPSVAVADYANRKALAHYCEEQVKAGHHSA